MRAEAALSKGLRAGHHHLPARHQPDVPHVPAQGHEVRRHVEQHMRRIGDDDALRLYEPASGDVVTLPRDRYVNGGFVVAGWTVPWAVVVPR